MFHYYKEKNHWNLFWFLKSILVEVSQANSRVPNFLVKLFFQNLNELEIESTGISVSKRPFPLSRYSNIWSEISSSNFRAFFQLWTCQQAHLSLFWFQKRAKIWTAYFWPKIGISAERKWSFEPDLAITKQNELHWKIDFEG